MNFLDTKLVVKAYKILVVKAYKILVVKAYKILVGLKERDVYLYET